MTLTLNPLMGNLSSTYSVLASRNLALCSRFAFNVYSYESDLQIGMELWRRRRRGPEEEEGLEWVYRKLGRKVVVQGAGEREEDVEGVLKARVGQEGGVGLLWEGRVKELLYSAGVTVDLGRGESMFRGVGVEVQYSS